MLQTDGAVADHAHRLAFDLRVALRHRGGDLLVRAREDLGLVVRVIQHGLVQPAEARSAVHGEVFDAERVQDLGHEVAAARGLNDGIDGRRLGFRLDVRQRRRAVGRGRIAGLGGGRYHRRGQRGGARKRYAA